MLTPVLLSGGVGSRLWPVSRESHPKQFLALAGELTMLQETLRRTSGLEAAAPIVVCNEEHRFMVAEQLRQLDLQPSALILEPQGRNTAPALALAALQAVTIRSGIHFTGIASRSFDYGCRGLYCSGRKISAVCR